MGEVIRTITQAPKGATTPALILVAMFATPTWTHQFSQTVYSCVFPSPRNELPDFGKTGLKEKQYFKLLSTYFDQITCWYG